MKRCRSKVQCVPARIIWHDLMRNVRFNNFSDGVIQCQQWNARSQCEHVRLVGEFTSIEFGFYSEACYEFIAWVPSLYDKTLPVGASGVGLHLGGARWLLLPTRPKPDPVTNQRQRIQLARASTMSANQPMFHQSSAAPKSLRRNHLPTTNATVHRAAANDVDFRIRRPAAPCATVCYATILDY